MINTRNIKLLVIFLLAKTLSSGDSEPAECAVWSKVEKKLSSEGENSLKCIKNSYCTGINCTGQYETYPFKAGLWLNTCSNPITVEILADIPTFNLINWRHSFSHNENVPIPGAQIRRNMQEVSCFLNMNIQKKPKSKYVTLGIKLRGRVQSSGFDYWLDMYDLLKPIQIPAPSCKDGHPVTYRPPDPKTTTTTSVISSTKASGEVDPIGQKCEINKPFTCGNYAVCKQTDNNMGVCYCFDGYHFDRKLSACVSSPSAEPPSHQEHEDKQSSDYIIILSAVLPIVALLFCAMIAFLSVRFRWWQRLRSRFQVRVYDQILIGGPQDLEDDEDPVA